MTENPFDLKTASPLALAYVGDAVIEIFVREALVCSGVSDTGKLSDASRAYVTASAQSRAVSGLTDSGFLSEDELAVFRRGKNARTNYHPKNQTVNDYHKATGFETLMGKLYLSGNIDRCREIFNEAYKELLIR